ncbi:MAG: hypothetical protein QE279_00340 [Rhodoferax sp.]|nr:hypothetical protein [Rhodoferax sp.]
MDAIRELLTVEGRTVTITLPDHFHAKRVEVIVLNADEQLAPTPKLAFSGRRPSPLLAGTRIVGDIMAPVVADADWDTLK